MAEEERGREQRGEGPRMRTGSRAGEAQRAAGPRGAQRAAQQTQLHKSWRKRRQQLAPTHLTQELQQLESVQRPAERGGSGRAGGAERGRAERGREETVRARPKRYS
jgi:hypothetical protein